MSNKRCEISINNQTTISLYRHFHTLTYGSWYTIPIEEIEPKKTITFISLPTSRHNDCCGKVQYNFIISNIEYIICIEFRLSILTGASWFNIVTAVESQLVILPSTTELITCQWRKKKNYFCNFEVYIVETLKGTQFFKECRYALQKSMTDLNRELKPFGFSCFTRPPVDILSNTSARLPRHFIKNIKNVGWEERLRTTTRSIYIRIVNLSPETWILNKPVNYEDLYIDEGVWVEFPKETLHPGSVSEFGIQSSGFFSSCKGSIQYDAKESKGQRSIQFFWDHGIRVSRFMINKHRCQHLIVTKHLDKGNAASAIFHFLNPNNLPRLELLFVSILTPQQIEKLGLTSISQDHTYNNTIHQNITTCSIPNIVSEFICYLRKIKAGVNVEPPDRSIGSQSRFACTEILPLQVQQFIAYYYSQHATTMIPHPLQCYIEWQIGHELFFNRWEYGDKFWLFTGLPGGCGQANIILSSTVIDWDRIPSPELLGLDKNKQLTTQSFQTDYYYRLTHPLPEKELLNTLITVMQSLGLGLQSLVVPHMKDIYGQDWFNTECHVPKDHLWKDVSSTDVYFDLEGVIFILVSRWDEVFETVFNKAGLLFSDLKIIQKACVCWANQELSRFTEDTVMEFLQQAYHILCSIKKNICADKINSCYHSLFQRSLHSVCSKEDQGHVTLSDVSNDI